MSGSMTPHVCLLSSHTKHHTSKLAAKRRPGKPREGEWQVDKGKDGEGGEEAGQNVIVRAGLKGRRGDKPKEKYPKYIVKNGNLSASTSQERQMSNEI